ncbi:MAG: S9 family peptidase [Chloroherpetonaceae bacterium]|nr:S9 family peptidase [Chthonomonadaceae bacterium]MDW8207490.1 S9 family peptidase [Chloroherpetonaceae bacterium]
MSDQTSSSAASPSSTPIRRRITPRALLEVRRISSPRLHPDGLRVAFVVTEADFEESRWVSHIWLTEWVPPPPANALPGVGASQAEGTRAPAPEDPARQLTFSYEGEHHPRWSPDGRYLAFLSARPDPTAPPPEEEETEAPVDQVWILPVDGGEARRITHTKESVIDYAWTPDGKEILYLTSEPRARAIETLRREERNRRKVDPVVEHDDRLRRQVWRIDVETRKPVLLFTGDYGIQECALSPDGRRLAYATNYTGLWNDYHRVDVYVRDLSTGEEIRVTDRPGGKHGLYWSPDGRQLAFLSWLDPEVSYSRQTLFVVNLPPSLCPLETRPATGVRTASTPHPAPEANRTSAALEPRLVTDLDHDLTEFHWSRHNGLFYAIASVGTGSRIVRIHPDGRTRYVSEEPAERRELDVCGYNSALVFVQETAQSLPELFLRDDFGRVHQLTHLNAGFLETHLLPRQEVVCWQSPDGLSIEGVLTYPLDYQEGKRYPLIVQVHGGPKGRAVNALLRGYSMPAVWSAEGYAVLQPNFRGSEGYGNAFALANRRDLGGGDFQDIMAGVDWCIAQGIADPERLGIMGGSYGGYMTNWAIGHTDRFKGAISLFGIFHLLTDYSNSELSRWDLDYLGAFYWEDPEIYRRLSPGSYVEQIRTPTLIIHGDEDNNTFISNSKEMYQALRQRGVITQFVHYPREGHGLSEPNHKLDEIRRCLAWMDRYVKHSGDPPGVYRPGDPVPHANGLLELCVTRAEIVTLAGQPKSAPPDRKPVAEETAFLEVQFTLHRPDTRAPIEPVRLSLEDVRLESRVSAGGPVQFPAGIPLEVAGVRSLLEGHDLHLTHYPDPDNGQLAFGFAVVFRVPRSGGDCLLRVADFPPVSVSWPVGDPGEAPPKSDS